jgi:predicted metal-dependent phosphoesterase TrpH
MIIDLHIHSKTSDGQLSVNEILKIAKKRKIDLMSITDHDSIASQEQAILLARKSGIPYISGVELNISFLHPKFNKGKSISLDLLGYKFDITNVELQKKIEQIVEYRKERISKILKKLNAEFKKEGLENFTKKDLIKIQKSADGTLGRPHIANYLITKKIVSDKKEAFEKYLVKCDVPKYPLSLIEASNLLRGASGKVILAHPNDPYGTSLAKYSKCLNSQTKVIQESMLPYIDGIECWHSRNPPKTTKHYTNFCKKHNLIMTGGSDCHQNPVIMGTVMIPDFVAKQFFK